MFDLTGKVAVVTGATRGLGRAAALGLSAAGARVVVSSRDQDACIETARQIEAETGAETFGLGCHVGHWETVPDFVGAVVAPWDRIDILVNNAGINPAAVPLESVAVTCGGRSSRSIWKARSASRRPWRRSCARAVAEASSILPRWRHGRRVWSAHRCDDHDEPGG